MRISDCVLRIRQLAEKEDFGLVYPAVVPKVEKGESLWEKGFASLRSETWFRTIPTTASGEKGERRKEKGESFMFKVQGFTEKTKDKSWASEILIEAKILTEASGASGAQDKSSGFSVQGAGFSVQSSRLISIKALRNGIPAGDDFRNELYMWGGRQ